MLDISSNISPNNPASAKYQHISQSMPSHMFDDNVSSESLKNVNRSQSMQSLEIGSAKSNVCDPAFTAYVHDNGHINRKIKMMQVNETYEIRKDQIVADKLVENNITTSNPVSTMYYSDMEEYSDVDNEEDENLAINITKNEITYISPRYWLQPARGVKESVNKQVRLNQDYLALAREYVRLKPYTDHNRKTSCVLCTKAEANVVFFPCEHRCVCKSCVKNEKICEDRIASTVSHGHSNCPVCAQIIKLILPYENGKVIISHLIIIFLRSFFTLSK